MYKDVKIKICGIKNKEDALLCVNNGANAIEMLVGQKHFSTDFISKEIAKEIVDVLPPFCSSVIVTHSEVADEIISICKFVNNTTIQLHSIINEDEVKKIKESLPYIKLIRLIHILRDGDIITDYKSMKYADAYLLDSFNLKTNQVGGTGLTHNWNSSKNLIQELNKPVILAGGLNPYNIVDAINIVNP